MSSQTKLKYHLIFVTKYRKPILDEEIMTFTISKITEALEKFKIDVIAIQGDDSNHIHIMIQAKPTQSISMIVRHLKQITSYHAWQNFGPRLRKTYWYKNLFWSSGYFCSTTGDASSETVKRYIEMQGD